MPIQESLGLAALEFFRIINPTGSITSPVEQALQTNAFFTDAQLPDTQAFGIQYRDHVPKRDIQLPKDIPEFIDLSTIGVDQVLHKLIGQQVTLIFAERIASDEPVKYYTRSGTFSLVTKNGDGNIILNEVHSAASKGYYAILIIGNVNVQQINAIIRSIEPQKNIEKSGTDSAATASAQTVILEIDKVNPDPQALYVAVGPNNRIISAGSEEIQSLLAMSLRSDHSFAYPPPFGNVINTTLLMNGKTWSGDVRQTGFEYNGQPVTIDVMEIDGYIVGVLPGSIDVIAYLVLNNQGKPEWTSNKPSEPTVKSVIDKLAREFQSSTVPTTSASDVIFNLSILALAAAAVGIGGKFTLGRLISSGFSSGSVDTQPSAVSTTSANGRPQASSGTPSRVIDTSLDHLPHFPRPVNISNEQMNSVKRAAEAGIISATAKNLASDFRGDVKRGKLAVKEMTPAQRRKVGEKIVENAIAKQLGPR